MFPFQALVKRELLTSLRRKRVFVWIFLLVLCCIGVIWLNWPEQNARPDLVAMWMEELLGYLTAVMLGGCILFIPSIAAGAIVAEREQDTIDLLRMSLIRGSGIVFAKLCNALGLFILLVITMAPAVGATLLGVGIERMAIVQVLILLLTVAMTCALAGLASSTFFRKTIWAVIGAYVLTAAALIGPAIIGTIPAIVFWFLPSTGDAIANFDRTSTLMRQLIEIVSYDALPFLASPVTAVIFIFDNNSWSSWWISLSIGLQVPIWLLFGVLTLRWLRRRDTHAIVANEEVIDDLDVLKARREQFPYYLMDPLKRKKPIEDSRNPMFVREVRWGLFSRMTTLMRLCLAIFAMFFIAALFPVFYDSGRTTDSEIIRMWAVVQYFITMMFAPALVANTFTKERELGNFDMMRMTLMSPRQILTGKSGAGMIVLSPVVIAVLVASIPLLFIGVRALPELGMSVVTGLVWAAFCVAVSITISLFSRRTVGALIASYALIAVVATGIHLVVDMIWVRTDAFDALPYAEKLQMQLPGYLVWTRYLNPLTAALDSDGSVNWWLNTLSAICIIALCYMVSALWLSRFRMQDR